MHSGDFMALSRHLEEGASAGGGELEPFLISIAVSAKRIADMMAEDRIPVISEAPAPEPEAKPIGARIADALEKIAAAIGAPQRGTCRICGCTHFEPCDAGCGWADATETLCDNPDCLAKAGLGASAVEESRHG